MLWIISGAVVAVAGAVRFGILCQRADARLHHLLQPGTAVEELKESR
jgi:hypothetical protein